MPTQQGRATAKKGASKAKKSRKPRKPATVSAEKRDRMVAEAAYYIAERRGFSGESSEEDWLQAEVEIDEMLAAGGGKSKRQRGG